MSATGGRGRAGRANVARVSQRRARSGERQSADTRPEPHRQRALVQRQSHGRGEQPDGAPLADGDAALFLDERGQRINGQWTGSPAPVEHDILTGSNADGTLAAGLTCSDWTSDSATVTAQVGHSDGMGPNQNTTASRIVLELGAREPELLEHGPARRRRSVLLLRSLEPVVSEPIVRSELEPRADPHPSPARPARRTSRAGPGTRRRRRETAAR